MDKGGRGKYSDGEIDSKFKMIKMEKTEKIKKKKKVETEEVTVEGHRRKFQRIEKLRVRNRDWKTNMEKIVIEMVKKIKKFQVRRTCI